MSRMSVASVAFVSCLHVSCYQDSGLAMNNVLRCTKTEFFLGLPPTLVVYMQARIAPRFLIFETFFYTFS